MEKSRVIETCLNKQIDKATALTVLNSHFWENDEWTSLELAYLQYNQDRLIMPQEVWANAVSEVIGEPVLNIFYGVPAIERMVRQAYSKQKDVDKDAIRCSSNYNEKGEI